MVAGVVLAEVEFEGTLVAGGFVLALEEPQAANPMGMARATPTPTITFLSLRRSPIGTSLSSLSSLMYTYAGHRRTDSCQAEKGSRVSAVPQRVRIDRCW